MGGWPESVHPCSSEWDADSSQLHPLHCCILTALIPTSADDEFHGGGRLEAKLQPLQVDDTETKPANTTSSKDPSVNTSSLLLEWRHAIHDLSAATPSAPLPPILSSQPTHMPAARAARHNFLRAALARKERRRQNALSGDDKSRRRLSSIPPSERHPIGAEVTAFVEAAGWSSTSLADVMRGGVEPGLSPRSMAILSPTDEDSEEIGQIMTDVTTTFLQATEQVQNHFRAGVGARQVIAIVANKMVLRDMPPMVGKAIVKAVTQPVLNIIQETLGDIVTQFLVPPSGMGAFVERQSSFHPMSAADLTHQAAQKLKGINAHAAKELERMEQEERREAREKGLEREIMRRKRMDPVSFLETQSSVQTAASTNARTDPDESDDSDDKYASFLSTYSKASMRHAMLAKGSGGSITDKIKAYLGPMLIHGIIHDAGTQLMNSLHVLLHESLSNQIHADLSQSLIDALTPSLISSISQSQVDMLSVALRTQLTREATHALTRSLTMLLTPSLTITLTRSLTRSPHADYYCHLCNNPVPLEQPAFFNLEPPANADPDAPYCLSCAHSQEHEYYLDYYAGYYSRYYASYYSYYYSRFYSRKFNDNVMGTCFMEPCGRPAL